MFSLRVSRQRNAAGLRRDDTQQRLLGVAADLGAEAAPHIGGDDLHERRVDTVGGGDGGAGALRALGAEPLVQPAVVAPRDRRAANLQRAGCGALVDEATLHHHFAVGEEVGAADGRHAEERRVEHHVAAGALVEQGGAGHGLLDVDQRGQYVVVDDHLLGCVLALRAELGDHDRDRLAHEAHLVDGQQPAGDHRVEGRRHRLQLEIGGGVDGDDAGHRQRIGGVDRVDEAVGNGGAHVRDVRGADEHRLGEQVVDVDPAGGEKPRVFLTKYPIAQNAASHAQNPQMFVETTSGRH